MAGPDPYPALGRKSSQQALDMKIAVILLLVLSATSTALWASDLSVNLVSATRADRVEVQLRWANAWRSARNHDAAWVVLRWAAEPERGALRLAASGHRVVQGKPALEILTSDDRRGVFIQLASEFRGDISCRVELVLDESELSGLSVDLSQGEPIEGGAIDAWAVEMVFVPGGSFELGDDHEGVRNTGAFHRVDGDGRPTGPFLVKPEAPIDVFRAPGGLWYEVGETPQYIGDQSGPIPAPFPKGTEPFYVMKYELRQGQYARFLSAVPADWRAARMATELAGEEAETWTIAVTEKTVRAGESKRPCNFLTWDDSSAWADWMALRPMTEFEFEKAALADSTKDVLAASHYWAMDLSGSLWERVISAGHPIGRDFTGTHGDGRLEGGSATNADWPRMEGREAPGIGYRGGADYFEGTPNETNPFSCVGTRQYAGWAGAFRYKTYSARACRTAPVRER